MTRLHGVIFVCVATGLGATMAAAGCSSSSSPATPGTPGGAEAGVGTDAAPDGAVTSVVLQWKVVNGATDDGGVNAGDSGASDGAAGDSAASDGATDGGATDGGGSGEAGGSDAGPGDAGAGADAPGPVGAEGGDTADAAGVSLGDLPPLPGVQVCVYQNSAIPCVTTQADGTFTMPGLPVRADIVISFQKSGYSSYLLPIETASTDMDGRSNPIFMDRAPGYVPPGVTYDPQKGIISAFAVQMGSGDAGAFVGVGGTHVSLSPMSGSGPYFLDQENQPDPTATSFTGITALYYNVDPGTYTLTYANSGYDCEPISFPFGQFGFPVTAPAHSLKIVVGAGYVTGIVGVLCTVNPVIVAVDGG